MQKPKSFRPWQPDQTTLLPPSPREWLAEDHQVYFLLDLVDELDLSQILGPAEAKDPRGEKGFDPRMMTMLLLYAYCVGIISSRKIERACYEDLAFRVLTANQQPDHSRISEFRRRHLSVHERGRVILVPLDQVVYLKAELKYITVRTREREFLIEESLTSLEEEFIDRFVRIHRNALVARPSIAGFERVTPTGDEEGGDPYWQVVLRDIPERLPVSRRQWSTVKNLVT